MIFNLPDIDDEVYRLRDQALEAWHRRLHEAGISIGILFASAPGDRAALKKGGYPVAAMIKPLSPQWRAVTTFDALLLIDENFWSDLEEPSRLALMDHELSHLDVLLEEDATGRLQPKRDTHGRPKLVYVPGDWNGGNGFRAVIARHGEHAIEFENSRRVFAFAKASLEAFDETKQEETPPAQGG